MKVVGLRVVYQFIRRHPDSGGALKTLIALMRAASWEKNTDIREMHGAASFLGARRVVFNIKGNKYRLDAKITYKLQIVKILRIGTHAEYDKWKF